MTQTQISKIYHSREDRISDLHSDNERIAYDGKDGVRLSEIADTFDEFGGRLCDSIDQYIESESDEDQEYNRRHLLECWSLTQAALSKVAWAMRFDGNIAYERMINALKDGSAADMRGL